MYLDWWLETIEPNYGDFRKRYYIPKLQIWKSISGVCQTQNYGFTVVSFSNRWFLSSKPRWKHTKILMCFAPSPSDSVRWGRRFWRPWELVIFDTPPEKTTEVYHSVSTVLDHLAGNDLQHLSTSCRLFQIASGNLTNRYWKWPNRNSGFSHEKWWIFP